MRPQARRERLAARPHQLYPTGVNAGCSGCEVFASRPASTVRTISSETTKAGPAVSAGPAWWQRARRSAGPHWSRAQDSRTASSVMATEPLMAREMGQPPLAASAFSWKVASSTPGTRARTREVAGEDRPAGCGLVGRDLRAHVDSLGWETGKRQLVAEGHGVAGGMGGRQQLLRAGLALRGLCPSAPRDGLLAEDATRGCTDGATARGKVTAPMRVCSSNLGHVRCLLLAVGKPYVRTEAAIGRPAKPPTRRR